MAACSMIQGIYCQGADEIEALAEEVYAAKQQEIVLLLSDFDVHFTDEGWWLFVTDHQITGKLLEYIVELGEQGVLTTVIVDGQGTMIRTDYSAIDTVDPSGAEI